MPVCSTCGTQYGSTVRICIRDGTPLIAGRADDPHIGKLLDGKYQIESFVSGGGMGAVYRAQHVMLGKTVAVKVIKNELVTSDEIVSRFQREARAASNLNHPNIVSVYDLGQASDGTLYIAMEFIDGPSLKAALRRDGPMPAARTVDILRQVASALSAAHRKQIVHRDLKSHNLMLATADDGRTIVKLVDFGIAKTFDETATQLTAAGYMLGTPHYMSPEQAAGRAVDHRADLYSLGVILYEMLTGEVPFGNESLASVLVKLATETPAPPSIRRSDLSVPPALEAVAMRCLEKDPKDRYQSADEFADALEQLATGAYTASLLPGPAAGATLVRPPADHPRSGPPPIPAAPDPSPVSGRSESNGPAALRPQSSVPTRIDRRVTVAVLVLVALGIAVASGVVLSDSGPEEGTASAPRQSVSPPFVAPPLVQAAPASNHLPAAESAAPGAAPAIRPQMKPAPQSVVLTHEAEARIKEQPAAQTAATATVKEPATQPAPVAPQQRPINPSVFLTCSGFPDVCSVIRSETIRAFQRDSMPIARDSTDADITIAAEVTLVSETTTAEFGTPLTTRTYSVELNGESRGALLAMPDPRTFGFDARFGNARLQENARLIAAGAADAARTFWTAGSR